MKWKIDTDESKKGRKLFVNTTKIYLMHRLWIYHFLRYWYIHAVMQSCFLSSVRGERHTYWQVLAVAFDLSGLEMWVALKHGQFWIIFYQSACQILWGSQYCKTSFLNFSDCSNQDAEQQIVFCLFPILFLNSKSHCSS